MQRSGAIPINPTQLSNSIVFYINSSLRHPHSHSSTSHQANMTSSGQITAGPVTVSSPTKRNTRRVREGGIRKAQSPKKRKNVTYPGREIAARFHPLNFIPRGDASSSACSGDACPVIDDWDPIEVIKNTFGEDCTYLDLPTEEENPPVEFPWSKEAAEMVAHANFVYDVCCEPYKHLYGM